MITPETDTRVPVWPLPADHPSLLHLQDLLAEPRCGLLTDIDGTISAVAPTVDQAILLPGIRPLLREAQRVFPVVGTISGRGVADQRRMVGVRGLWHVGHHGYEWIERTRHGRIRTLLLPGVEPYLTRIAQALDEIEGELAPQVEGLWMERKGITGGVHWRQAPDHQHAEAICTPVIQRVAAKYGLRTRGGKLAIELFPPVITHKGEGLRSVIRRHNLASVMYLGDDTSDTDAFTMIRHLREHHVAQGLAIGVLHPNSI